MDADSPEVRRYLYQLNQLTESDPDKQVSMYEVGAALGIPDDESASLAEILFMSGQAELKTLSGGIGISAAGMDALGVTPVQEPGDNTPCLSGEPVLTDQDRKLVDTLLSEIKGAIAREKNDYQTLECLVVDIKTIEVYLLSAQPKTAVIQAIFNAVAQDLPEKGYSQVRSQVAAMAGQGQ